MRYRVVIGGFWKQSFDTGAFLAALAATLQVDTDRITLRAVEDAPLRRSAAAPAVAVTSDIAYPAGTSAAAVLDEMNSSSAALIANLFNAGMTGFSVKTVSPSVLAGVGEWPPVTGAAIAAAALLGALLVAVAAASCQRVAPADRRPVHNPAAAGPPPIQAGPGPGPAPVHSMPSKRIDSEAKLLGLGLGRMDYSGPVILECGSPRGREPEPSGPGRPPAGSPDGEADAEGLHGRA
jgi:hypothetical protein